MLIDWFTVIAQIVNFLVLVILLKYLLYDRVIQAMDRREERIGRRLEDADNKRKEAEAEAESYRKRKEELEHERDEMLSSARKEAEEEGAKILRDARGETRTLQQEWRRDLETERDGFLREIKRMAALQVYSMSRKALKDLADEGLEERIIEVFISRLGEIPAEKKERMIHTSGDEEFPLKVKSGFEISTDIRRMITEAVRKELDAKAGIEYETDPGVIMGIELKAKGGKVAWNVENYLADLEQSADDALRRESSKGHQPEHDEAKGGERRDNQGADRDDTGNSR